MLGGGHAGCSEGGTTLGAHTSQNPRADTGVCPYTLGARRGLHVQLQFYWAVVAAEDAGVDAGIEELWAQPL